MEVDYSFLYVGGLYKDSVRIMRELCQRFGADKAENVYSTAIDCMRRDLSQDDLIKELNEECSVKPSADDLRFLRDMCLGVSMIAQAREHLNAAVDNIQKRRR